MSVPEIAVLVPCRNEEVAVAAVVRGFRTALPGCTVYVYDNASTDATARRAREAGAIVRAEPEPGKGTVVRRMFADVEADIYVLVDGDDTYDAASAPAMVELLRRDRLDMVVGTRHPAGGDGAFRPGHRFGNRLLTRLATHFFGRGFSDMLSGYRVFSRRFVKSFPCSSRSFEIETEITVHALQMRLPSAEVATRYTARPSGSQSKLNTCGDGLRILLSILLLFKEVKPLAFFALVGAVLATMSLGLAVPLLVTYLATGLVPRFPTAILSTGLMLMAFLGLVCGLVLDNVIHGRMEQKRLRYLELPPVMPLDAPSGARRAAPAGRQVERSRESSPGSARAATLVAGASDAPSAGGAADPAC